jgi:hypothetical protein
MMDSASALSYESPALPTEGSMPPWASRSVYRIDRYCTPCQRSPKESHSGSPIWSQCDDVTGSLPCWWTPFLLRSVAAAGATGAELLFGVLGPEALAGDLDEVCAVGQSVEGGGGQQRFAEEFGPLRPITIAREEN